MVLWQVGLHALGTGRGERDLREAVWRTYRYLWLLRKDGTLSPSSTLRKHIFKSPTAS